MGRCKPVPNLIIRNGKCSSLFACVALCFCALSALTKEIKVAYLRAVSTLTAVPTSN